MGQSRYFLWKNVLQPPKNVVFKWKSLRSSYDNFFFFFVFPVHNHRMSIHFMIMSPSFGDWINLIKSIYIHYLTLWTSSTIATYMSGLTINIFFSYQCFPYIKYLLTINLSIISEKQGSKERGLHIQLEGMPTKIILFFQSNELTLRNFLSWICQSRTTLFERHTASWAYIKYAPLTYGLTWTISWGHNLQKATVQNTTSPYQTNAK